jgi:ribonuclease E
LRLRDLGGLVVIDFIDMMNNRNQRAVENRLNAAVQVDRARVQIGRISRFGLLEMSRQRLKPSLGESTQIVCPRCTGQGTIRTVESLSLSLVRIIEEEALKSGTARVDIQVPVDVATYILNEKRQAIADIEKLTGVHVLIVANPTLETPQYKVERIRKSEHDESDETASYLRAEKDDKHDVELTKEKPIQPEKAAVSSISPGRRPTPKKPVVEAKSSSPGLLGKIVSIFTGDKEEEKEDKKPAARQRSGQGSGQSRNQRSGQNRNRSNRGRGRSRNRKPAANRDASQGKQQASKQSKSQTDKSQSDKKRDASANTKDSAQSGAKSGRSRRRRSNRPKSNESKAADVKSTETNKQGTNESSAPAKQAVKETQKNPATQAASPQAASPQVTSSQTTSPQATSPQATSPQATSPQATSPQKKDAQEKKTSAPSAASKPAADKPVSAQSNAENKPQATQNKTPDKSRDTKSSDKQPVSNENRPAISVIDD